MRIPLGDETLTGRTDIWEMALRDAKSPNVTGKFPGAQVLFTTAALRVPEGMPVAPETRPYSEGFGR